MSSREQHERGGERRSLREAVVQARTKQADRLDVIADLNAAEMTRLELLMSELEPVVADLPAEADQFQCALTPGDPPRLWVDMVSHVVMAPDKRTYRFVTDSRAGRSVRLETEDVARMADFTTEYLAHRLVDRERVLTTGADDGESHGYTGIAVILAFLSGACVGVLGIFILAMALVPA